MALRKFYSYLNGGRTWRGAIGALQAGLCTFFSPYLRLATWQFFPFSVVKPDPF